MKIMQWKNLRIDPTKPEMTIQEKFVAFGFLGVPAISALLIALALGSKNEMYWALAALGFGFSTALWKMHPQSHTVNWKHKFFMYGVPALVVPTLLEFGVGIWAFVAAGVLHFAVKLYFKQTTKTEGA